MDTPAKLINILERHAAEKELFWAGGHFHWELEEPRKKYGVTAFMGGRFRFDESPEEHYSYMRLFDDGKIIDLKLTI